MVRLALSSALALWLSACAEPLPPPPEIQGRPCALSSAARFVSEGRRTRTMHFNDLTIRLRGGHASCRAYHQASVCHFSAPIGLHVTQRRKAWWFHPGAGERVALSVVKDQARCVVEAPETVEEWAGKHMLQPRPLR